MLRILIHILNFVKYYAGFFFSIGVVLRAFPPTRGAGAYLMAMSIGLYFVFPISYLLIASAALPHTQSILTEPVASGDFHYNCLIPDPNDVKALGCNAADISSAMSLPDQLAANKEQMESAMTIQIDDFTRHISHVICLFPMIAFVVLLTFVLNTTNLFGGNIPEIGRGLVKLI